MMLSKTSAAIGPVLFPFTGMGVGGSHISTFHLARALGTRYKIRSVIVAAAHSQVAESAAEMGLEVLATADVPAKRRDFLADLLKLPERVRTLRSYGSGAIIHCSDLWTLQAWGSAAKLLRLPVVYHHRAILNMSVLDRKLLQMAHSVISISEPCRRNLGFLREAEIDSIVNPFSEPVFDPDSGWRAEFNQIWGVDETAVLVGFVGNLQRRKRPGFFVDVCSIIAQTLPNARFALFGSDREESKADLKKKADELGIGDKIILPGFRSPSEKNFATLDLLLVPALAEPFGRTLVEALLLGIPYVATDDAGHSEIARRWAGGRLVTKNATAEEFAKVALDVLVDPKGTALPTEVRRKIADELSPARHAENVLAVYKRIRADS
ncbi:glycosyltransferase family 4 protein [Microvirga calopogonii]|uniref:glycosyltransferase family 4 protein n=1 Tax=Microvirga calopogonii TaxID=2078013 RepID=UPI000E0D7F61|nr:glycosyltransferase family 4 protein [Microvirga calopogonii]